MDTLQRFQDAVRFRVLLAIYDLDPDGPADLFKVVKMAGQGLSEFAAGAPDNEAEIKFVLGTIGDLFNEGYITAFPKPPRIGLSATGLVWLADYVENLASKQEGGS